MRLALLLRHRRRLLMQLNPHINPLLDSPTHNLKRPLHLAHARTPSPSSSAAHNTPSVSDNQRPVKVIKLDPRSKNSLSTMPPGRPSGGSSSRGGSRSKPGPGSSKLGPSRSAKNGNSTARKLPGPFHDKDYIRGTHCVRELKSQWAENPKSPVNNWMVAALGKQPSFEITQGNIDGSVAWRSTLRLQLDGEEIIAIGDHVVRKDAEKLAALSAAYQLDAKNLLSAPTKSRSDRKQTENSSSTVTLQDGSVVDYERARQFMDYYCRRFGFGKPDVTYNEVRVSRGGNTSWEAVMTVGGRRIGIGTGNNKKQSTINCYVDVTQYLEKCDPDLWAKFVADSKAGKDLGLAPKVLFQTDVALDDRIQDAVSDIKKSTLYRNRPKIGSTKTGADAPDSDMPLPAAPRSSAPYRRPISAEYLESKSQALLERRKAYLEDARLEKMRNTRATLPVYTQAEEVLSHVRNHDVSICMAATGSGKTTQIPQLILDEWIEKGNGAKCNIVCTQPRRLAAISVADRVASERGESTGRGSVGYQVRFEAKLPEEHGSITFCTTGIFLKRMQSALEDGHSSRNLDDVTHIIVDEVHERDVDTDLLLVVLKRLLEDRKARKKPLKVVLMSATIDPTLFQNYFPDAQGCPAGVIQIPGRAFPVQKHYLDTFLPDMITKAPPETRWVFDDDSVQKYLSQEIGPDTALPRGFLNPRFTTSPSDIDRDEDIPYPFVALTISHVLRSSDDGHVLVFLPGWDEIMGVQKCLLGGNRLGINFTDTKQYSIHLLHSSIPVGEQQVIFEPPPLGVRRIILATNIAETSVTIPDVVYVVDTGKVKEQRYDPERHISSLVSAWVGTSNLNQRAGRAGRHRSGDYYGVLGSRRAEQLPPHQTVEMKRVDLSNIVMHVKALAFPGMTVQEVLAATIEPPAADRVEAAIKSLQTVGALDKKNNLTSLGHVLLQLPLDAQMGRLILYGSFFRCLDQALTLAAILTNRDPFVAPMHLKAESAAKKNYWCPEDFRSDPLATLRAYHEWWDMQSKGDYVRANRFCMDNFLSKPTLLMIQKIKAQLLQSLYQAGVISVSAGGSVAGPVPRGSRRQEVEVPPELNQNADSLPLLAALIAIASQPKFAIRIGEKSYRTAQDKMVFIHPSSVNHRKREIVNLDVDGPMEKQIIAFAEKRQNLSGSSAANPQKFLVTTTRLDPLTYILFGAYHIEVTARGLECDEWLPIVGNVDTLDDVERLKVLMESCMLRVFEGILATKTRGRRLPMRDVREEESGDEDDNRTKDLTLSAIEIKELDAMTQDIVRILNRYSDYRLQTQSRTNSRPATPMDSPQWGSSRLPYMGGTRSGYSTPYHGGSIFSSRPTTPSHLSRRYHP